MTGSHLGRKSTLMLWTGMHSTLAAHTFIREHHCTSTLQSQRSKFTSEMAEADWDEVTYLRKKPQRAADAKSQKAVNQAQRRGEEVDTSKKFSASANKQHSAAKDTAKLDRETEELRHDRVTLDFGRTLQQARMAKKWTQKDLATRVNEKPQVVNDYESGKAIPNQQIISKLERAVGVKLRGKDTGEPLGPRKK